VVDLSLSAESPVTNARALSDEPGRAVPLALQIIRGIQSEGAAATAKHFPGTDDSEKIDPHLAPVNNAITKEKWAATNGKMYEAVIGGGVYAVMTGHQNIPAYQTRKSNGRYPPATASEEAVSGLLKDKLGFQGVAVTDALNMGGFVGADGLKNQVESLKAGNDMLLWPALEYIDEAERKVLAGELPMARLDEAVSRVLALKGKVMPPNGAINRAAPDKERALALSREINEKGITLVQNVRGVLPNAALKKALVVAVTPDERNYADLRRLAGIFAQYGVAADVRRDIWQDALYESQEEYDLIIFALCRMTHRPIGPLDFWGDNAASIWASNSADLSKTVTVSFGNPYAFKYYRETEMTYINAYSPERAALEAFAKGITGIIPFTGTSPVRLS
jgi:beta-N-acetylhexosaminidase